VVTNAATVSAVRAQVAGMPGVVSVSQPVVSPDVVPPSSRPCRTPGPADAQTYALVQRLHTELPAGTDLTGRTAAVVDLTGVLAAHLWQVVTAVLAATSVLLGFVFRSIVVPLRRC
jgi:RND superfamily putative drug exporter